MKVCSSVCHSHLRETKA